MKVLTTVKEVAGLADNFEVKETEVDDKYLEYDMNEWDGYAVEEGVQLSEAGVVDEVVTVTIGPKRAEETIRMALAKGADRSIRVWDEALEGPDLLDVKTKTKILSAVVAEEDPNLVLTGVQAGDDAFGATGVSLADEIDFEWGTVVNALDIDTDADVAHVHRELEGGVRELTDIQLPAVLTIQTGINEPRYASMRAIRRAQSNGIATRTLADLDLGADAIKSDLTLSDMYEPESGSGAEIFEGSTGETATELADVLRDRGVVQ